jgi:probable rRNA maturation factor
MRRIWIRNRQKRCRVDATMLRQLARYILENCFSHASFELAIHLISEEEMSRLNETFLQHHGPTDVITFNNLEMDSDSFAAHGNGRAERPQLAGEIFICPEVAIRQAREFGVSWQAELARYVIHGVLHMEGYDDLEPDARRKMKREENRLLKRLSLSFPLSNLGQEHRLRP